METRAVQTGRANMHTEAEIIWAKEKISEGKNTLKQIRENNLVQELETKFNRKITVGGLYTWFRYIIDPEAKKRYNSNRKSSPNSEKPNAKFIREKDTFEKSAILAYINHHIVGFESDTELKDFMQKNQVIGENVFIFKKIPVKIEYNVTLG